MTKRKLNRQQKSRISARQKQLEKSLSCPSSDTENDFDKGLVISHHGKETLVELEDGSRLKCHNRQNILTPVAGDNVLIDGKDPSQAVVVSTLSRKSVLGRLNYLGQLKPVAANIDNLIIVFAPEPIPSDLLIDSYLVAAHFLNIKPLLVFNKADISHQKTLIEHYQFLDYPIVVVSSRQNQGMDALLKHIENETSVFVGQSGVGKSSLISTLLPHESIETQQISARSALGKHTTSNSCLYHLDNKKGAIIDSPGIREFSLGKLNPAQILQGFPEFQHAIGRCKFRNCQHQQEPECAISQLANGCIHKTQRAANLRRILQNHSSTFEK